jgi:hypothetical protein
MKTNHLRRTAALVSLGAVMLITGAAAVGGQAAKGGRSMAFTLQTKSFAAGGEIPRKYTCSGEDVSPELSWSEPPAGTQSLALIMDDPDAPVGTFTHWGAYDLPPQTRQLAEGATLPGEARQGRNDFGRTGYGGPCPPPGKPHRYYFKLYALDTKLNLKSGASKADLERAMKGHILAQAEIMGTFKR